MRRGSCHTSTRSNLHEEDEKKHLSCFESNDEEYKEQTSEAEVETLFGRSFEKRRKPRNICGSYKNVILDLRDVKMNDNQRTCLQR